MASSCRALVASLLLGLQALVQELLSTEGVSHYYLGGFQMLSESTCRLAVLASVAGYVPDAVLMELLEDDRVALRADTLEQCLSAELEWLSDIPDEIFTTLSSLLSEDSGASLRSDCLEAGLLAAAYIKSKFLDVCQEYPWKLVRTPAHEAFATLAALPQERAQSLDDTTAKVHALLSQGYYRHVLEDGIQLLAQVRWSTSVVEQGHASATLTKRAHQQYGVSMLVVRSHLHMMRALFTPLPQSRSEKDLRKKITKLTSSVPEKLSGRQVFYADFIKKVKASSPGQTFTREQARDVMKRHVGFWQKLSPAQQLIYEARAQELRDTQRSKNSEELREVTTDLLALQEAKVSAEADEVTQETKISTCKFSKEALIELASWLKLPKYSLSNCKSLHQKHLEPPNSPSLAVQRELESITVSGTEQKPGNAKQSSWVAQMARQRQCMRSCALRFEAPSGDLHWYAFLFATQRPFRVHLLRLTSRPLPAQNDSSIFHTHFPLPEFSFEYKDVDVCSDKDIPSEWSQPWVLPMLAFRQGHIVDSHAYLIPFVHYVELQPQASTDMAAGDGPPGGKRQKVDSSLIEQHPWLAQYMQNKPETPTGIASSSTGSAAHLTSTSDVAVPLADHEYDSVFSELEQRRREWSASLLLRQEHFKTSMLGGAWTKAHTGQVTDAIKAAASGTSAMEFCARFHLQKQASFAIQKYSERRASELALFWCAKMEHYFQIWADNPQEEFCFTDQHHDAFCEDEVVEAIFSQGNMGAACSQRLNELKALKP